MEGLGIEEKIGVMCSPLGKCFKDNSLRAVGNKEKSHTCALDSRPTGIGTEDSGREVRPPSHTPHDIQKKKKALWERLALPLTSFPMLLPGSQHSHHFNVFSLHLHLYKCVYRKHTLLFRTRF